MRKRPGESPQKSGRRFERFWAALFGVEPQKGSGNVWYAKLDVGDGTFTFSCKWTEKESHSISKELLREADNAIRENGDNSIPAIAIALDGGTETVVVCRASDFVRILESEQSRYIVPTKGEQKRRRSRLPGLLRDED
jgi:hypothetical protein